MSTNRTTNAAWFAMVPGSTAENGYGDHVSVDTKWTGGIVDQSWFTEAMYEKYRQPCNFKIPFLWLKSP